MRNFFSTSSLGLIALLLYLFTKFEEAKNAAGNEYEQEELLMNKVFRPRQKAQSQVIKLMKHDAKFKKFRKPVLRSSQTEQEAPKKLIMKSLSTVAKINFDQEGYVHLFGSQSAGSLIEFEARLVRKEKGLDDSYIGIKICKTGPTCENGMFLCWPYEPNFEEDKRQNDIISKCEKGNNGIRIRTLKSGDKRLFQLTLLGTPRTCLKNRQRDQTDKKRTIPASLTDSKLKLPAITSFEINKLDYHYYHQKFKVHPGGACCKLNVTLTSPALSKCYFAWAEVPDTTKACVPRLRPPRLDITTGFTEKRLKQIWMQAKRMNIRKRPLYAVFDIPTKKKEIEDDYDVPSTDEHLLENVITELKRMLVYVCYGLETKLNVVDVFTNNPEYLKDIESLESKNGYPSADDDKDC
uniref:Uncharacterized protein n=1 Tax=Ditylenchus dipsaci TaxID=166011 RepID=A0A915DZP8_9BILA